MDIYVLNNLYEPIGFIDEADSVLWDKKYNDIGSAEIYVPCNDEMLSLLKRGYYLYRYDDDMFCKIESVEIETDVENGDYIIATATDICTILSGRIVRSKTIFSGRVVNFILKLVTDNAIKPPADQADRKINDFVFDTTGFSGFSDTLDTVAIADDLLQLIITTCKTYNYGFRMSYDIEAQQLVFRLYKGKNKATTESEEYVEFSPQFSNILTSNYKEDESNYKNVCYVGYKNTTDEEVHFLSVFTGEAEPKGEARHEIYVDGTGTNRNITYDELFSIYGDELKRYPATMGTEISGYYYITVSEEQINVATFEVSTTDGVKSEKITMTDYTYLYLIRSLGYNTLAEHIKTHEYTGNVDTIGTYEYKVDYNLGDIVKVINEYGIEAEAQIIEIMESDDADNGYVVEPKFEFKEV